MYVFALRAFGMNDVPSNPVVVYLDNAASADRDVMTLVYFDESVGDGTYFGTLNMSHV